MNPQEKPGIWLVIRSQWLLLTVTGLYCWAFSLDQGKALLALQISAETLASVLLLIAAVFGLVGLLQVWISRDLIVRLLGREGGVRGLLLAALCGTLLIGPAYIIFPLLMSIHKQGARWAVVTIVLSAYAVKLQMIPIEIEFLGWPFALGRSLLTVALAIPTGLLVEALMERSKL
ncbi:MAG: hypothetical protein C0619_08410 [Desulfuromonas sp.]|nr:MAG: hypothetical protein C0619_08410 [Desulfuromonas sp.]